MPSDTLLKVDLNLLLALHVLLEESSTTKAAARMHVSQSAMSKTLGRLRQVFNDPLFTRSAYGLVPTPRATALHEQLSLHLAGIQSLIATPEFDHTKSERDFRFATIDGAFQTLIPLFFPHIRKAAPNIGISFMDWNEESSALLGEGKIDLALIAREKMEKSLYNVKELPKLVNHQIFLEDDIVCLVRRQHPVLALDWDLDTFLAFDHIQMYCEGFKPWMLDLMLDEMGLTRKVAARVPSFHGAVALAECDDVIFCTPRRYAEQIIKRYQLVMLPMPFEMEKVTFMLAWHQIYDQDPGHIWLRNQIVACLAQ